MGSGLIGPLDEQPSEERRALDHGHRRRTQARVQGLQEAAQADASGRRSGLSPGSKTSKIGGITPPPGHPPGVWDELAAEGKLKKEGHGIYSLASEIQPKSTLIRARS